MLIGADAADDAGVCRLEVGRALIQTVDFFTPVVDDPYDYGQIAAANALSDVFAMGGRPLTALNILCVPEEHLRPETVRKILLGGAAKAREARCPIIGGHSVKSPEPIYGVAVTGIVDPRRLITNASARPNDHLLLTKPLGTGIVTTAIKEGLAPSALAHRAVSSMRRLNSVGPDLAERRLVRAGTDITGFGLLGHLASLCRQSGVGAQIDVSAVPVLGRGVWDLIGRGCIPGGTRRNLGSAESIADWLNVTEEQKLLLADAQTSGGLLLCVADRHLAGVLARLRAHDTASAARIGRIVRSSGNRILVKG